MQYESCREVNSQAFAGVRFRVNRMSFGRRADLARRVRELASRMEFHEAGDSEQDQLSASLMSLDVDRLYIEWGLASLEGLEIDGQPATPDALLSRGPDQLCREIVRAVKAECVLSEEERKN